MINLNGYEAMEHACKCGKTHSAYTKYVEAGEGAIAKLPSTCKEILAEGRIGIVCDENVRHIALDTEGLLVCAGYRTRLFTYAANFVSTREEARKLIEANEEIRLWVAVGTGSIADTVRYSASCRGNEWVLLLTAPSTDSVMYPYCDYTENGVRETFRATPPLAAIIDYDIIENAPKFTVAAGYGTLISKLMRAFDFAFDDITDKGRCKYLTSEFIENLTDFFSTQSCESISLRICRALVKLGLVAQLADDTDFTQGGEYFAAYCLKKQCNDTRLLGENAALTTFTAYCILDGYLKTVPEDLYIPSSAPEFYRYLDKTCSLNCISLLRNAKTDNKSEAHLYVLKEYADDLLTKLHELFGSVKSLAKQFRRLYDDAGYWMGSYCSEQGVLKTVCAAYATFGDGLLSSLSLGGALEEAI